MILELENITSTLERKLPNIVVIKREKKTERTIFSYKTKCINIKE
jgi:hypothetical protein